MDKLLEIIEENCFYFDDEIDFCLTCFFPFDVFESLIWVVAAVAELLWG